MPTFNREGLVRHAIQSILDQTYDAWELVVIDDGSTDGTKQVVEAFAKKDKRIRYYRNQKNRGISYSRNKGNKLARAEIIVVQDSDDMSLPNRLWEIAAHFHHHPETDFLYHSFYIRAVDIHYGLRAIHREVHVAKEYDRKMALQVPYIPGQVAYQRTKVLATPYREEVKTWDDWMLIMEWSIKGYRFAKLDSFLYEYVISDDSVTTAGDYDGTRDQDKETVKRVLRDVYGINATG